MTGAADVRPFYSARTEDPEHLASPALWFQSCLDGMHPSNLDRAGWITSRIHGGPGRFLQIQVYAQRPADACHDVAHRSKGGTSP